MIARALEPIEEEIIPTTATTIYAVSYTHLTLPTTSRV